MLRLLRWLVGYVSFTAEEGFTERFLNLCNINEISLWNIENDGVKVKAVTSRRGFEKLSVPAKNSGMTIKNVKKKGLCFLVERYKYRFGLALGLVFAILFIWFMSGFIWNVEVVGGNSVKLENFTEILSEEGVRVGARKSKIDILQIQQNLLDRIPSLSWVSVNIFGSKAQVEYTVINENKPLDDAKKPINVVASKDGKIVLIESYRGKNEVKEGAFVAKGTLLISGVTVNSDLSENIVHASGKVYAITDNTSIYTEKNINKANLVFKTDNRYLLNIFGVTVPLGFKNEQGIASKNSLDLEGNGNVLPLSIIREDSLLLSESKADFTDEQLKLIALRKCIIDKRKNYNDAEFKKITYSFINKDDKIAVKCNIKCVENIAKEVDVYVEEN